MLAMLMFIYICLPNAIEFLASVITRIIPLFYHV
jgi:hypothetical protein